MGVWRLGVWLDFVCRIIRRTRRTTIHPREKVNIPRNTIVKIGRKKRSEGQSCGMYNNAVGIASSAHSPPAARRRSDHPKSSIFSWGSCFPFQLREILRTDRAAWFLTIGLDRKGIAQTHQNEGSHSLSNSQNSQDSLELHGSAHEHVTPQALLMGHLRRIVIRIGVFLLGRLRAGAFPLVAVVTRSLARYDGNHLHGMRVPVDPAKDCGDLVPQGVFVD